MARRAARAFGLGLYGLDIIESEEGPKVVDLNYFPGYKGIPEAAKLLTSYIVACARGTRPIPAPELSTHEGRTLRANAVP